MAFDPKKAGLPADKQPRPGEPSDRMTVRRKLMVMEFALLTLSVLGLATACSTDRKVSQTSVNEVIPSKGPVFHEKELQEGRQPDPIPYRELQLEGELLREDIQRVVHQSRKALDHCYRNFIDRDVRAKKRDDLLRAPILNSAPPRGSGIPFKEPDPILEGDVVLFLTVTPEGKVKELRTSRSDFRYPPFENCVEIAARNFQFPARNAPTLVKNLVLRFHHETGVIKGK